MTRLISETSDTSPEVEAWLLAQYMKRSPAERIRMASGMFDDAMTIVRAGIMMSGVTDPTEIRVQVFLRFYGRDLDEEMCQEVVRRLRAEAA
jgi:hypothetical protein